MHLIFYKLHIVFKFASKMCNFFYSRSHNLHAATYMRPPKPQNIYLKVYFIEPFSFGVFTSQYLVGTTYFCFNFCLSRV